MKKALLIITLATLFMGCKMNPNKEARIQKLESSILTVTADIKLLENKTQTLETIVEQLKIRIQELEK